MGSTLSWTLVLATDDYLTTRGIALVKRSERGTCLYGQRKFRNSKRKFGAAATAITTSNYGSTVSEMCWFTRRELTIFCSRLCVSQSVSQSVSQPVSQSVSQSNTVSIFLPPAHHSHPPSHIHCFIPGSKLTFSTDLFHHSLLAPTWTAFLDYTGPDLLCSTVFHF